MEKRSLVVQDDELKAEIDLSEVYFVQSVTAKMDNGMVLNKVLIGFPQFFFHLNYQDEKKRDEWYVKVLDAWRAAKGLTPLEDVRKFDAPAKKVTKKRVKLGERRRG